MFEEDIQRLVHEVVSYFGCIDVLVSIKDHIVRIRIENIIIFIFEDERPSIKAPPTTN